MLFKKNIKPEPAQESSQTQAQTVELVQPETVVCKNCKRELDKKRVVKNKYVCYECGYYFRVRAKNRIRMVTDAESFTEWDENVEVKNPLNFPENVLQNKVHYRSHFSLPLRVRPALIPPPYRSAETADDAAGSP